MNRRSFLAAAALFSFGGVARGCWLGIEKPEPKPAKPFKSTAKAPLIPSKASPRWTVASGSNRSRSDMLRELTTRHRYARRSVERLTIGQMWWIHDTEHDRHGHNSTRFGRLLDGMATPPPSKVVKAAPDCPT